MLNKKLFSKLIRINSVFPNEKQVAEFLQNELESRGFQISLQHLNDKRWNIVATYGQSERTVMYYAHMDTVPAYDGWTREPFELSENSTKYFGRGVADMKGGIAAFLSAFDLAKNNLAHRVLFVLGVDEENISAGSDLFCRLTTENPDVVISLEGDALEKEWPFPLIVTWGRRGRVAFEATVPGISAHGATLSEGVNAISEASRLILNLDEMKLSRHELLPPATQYIRSINADAGSLSIPDHVTIMIDRHLVPPETSQSVLEEIRNHINKFYDAGVLRSQLKSKFNIDVMKRDTPYLEPFCTDRSNEISRAIEEIIFRRHGEIPANYGTSVADENAFAKRFECPVLCIGPVGDNYHGADEWVLKSSMEAITQTYLDLLQNLKK